MKQHEAVIRVMEQNGGYATLGHLYQNVLKVPDCEWKTQTPFASMRRIVQQSSQIFKILPGLWALESHRAQVLEQFSLQTGATKQQTEEFNHTYFQGLIVEIGNLKQWQTFVPAQDKNRVFLHQPLNQITTLHQFHEFTYQSLVSIARMIDVTWFNTRGFPQAFFEVEHSTDILNSLSKFAEFQDFQVEFNIVADAARQNEFMRKLARSSLTAIQSRVKFVSYEAVSQYHTKLCELAQLQTPFSNNP